MSERWIRDTGLIFALLALFLGISGIQPALYVSSALLLALLINPRIVWPLAYVWHTIAMSLGFIMNTLFFSLTFFLVITPIGLFRRLTCGDQRALSLDKSVLSMFSVRADRIEKSDMEKPF